MRRVYYEAYYHLVWSTKRRLPLITPERERTLYPFVSTKLAQLSGHLVAIGNTLDHVHVCAILPPVVSISKVMNIIKGASSHFISQNEAILSHKPDFFEWQDGYGLLTVSAHDVETIIKYIRNQKSIHGLRKINKRLEIY